MNRLLYRWTRPQINSEGQELLDAVVQSGQWSYGPVARQVERNLEKRLGVPKALLTNSGTSALWILLQLAKKRKQQAIIVPAFGYSAAANIAASLGYDIYVADTMPDAPVVDPASAKRLLSDDVAMIVGINYFGYSVDWDEIPKNDSYQIIEDAAGSYGAKYKGHACGSNAESAIMSFHTSKAAAAGGEGGCILGGDELIKQARTSGRNGHVSGYYFAEKPGMNLLMTDVAACFLHDTIEHFDDTLDQRQQIVKSIDNIVESAGLAAPAFNRSGNGREQNYQTYAMFTENRDLVIELLRLNGVEARPCWPFLITEQPATKGAVKKIDGELANAKSFARRIVNIPVYPTDSNDQIERLGSVISRIAATGIMGGKSNG